MENDLVKEEAAQAYENITQESKEDFIEIVNDIVEKSEDEKPSVIIHNSEIECTIVEK